jgi:hypothetical protein
MPSESVTSGASVTVFVSTGRSSPNMNIMRWLPKWFAKKSRCFSPHGAVYPVCVPIAA